MIRVLLLDSGVLRQSNACCYHSQRKVNNRLSTNKLVWVNKEDMYFTVCMSRFSEPCLMSRKDTSVVPRSSNELQFMTN